MINHILLKLTKFLKIFILFCLVLLPCTNILASEQVNKTKLNAIVDLDAYKHYYTDSSVSTKTQLGTFLLKNNGSSTVVIEQITVMLSGDYDDNYGPNNIEIWDADMEGIKNNPISSSRNGVLVKNSIATFNLTNVIVLSPGNSRIITYVGDVTNMFPPQNAQSSYYLQSILVKCKGRNMSNGQSFVGPSNGAVIADRLEFYDGSYI